MLPIQSTKAFRQAIETVVNHFINSIKQRATPINNRNAFYKKVGYRFQSSWIPEIRRHPKLLSRSKFQKRIVLCRLYSELKIKSLMDVLVQCFVDNVRSRKMEISNKAEFFETFGVDFESEWLPLIITNRNTFEYNEFDGKMVIDILVNELGIKELKMLQCVSYLKERMELDGRSVFVTSDESSNSDIADLTLPDCAFNVSVNGVHAVKQYEFQDASSFRIPVISSVLSAECTVGICVKPKGDVFDFGQFQTLMWKHPLEKYEVDSDVPLRLNTVLNVCPLNSQNDVGGRIAIHCTSDLNIDEDGQINADHAGLRANHQCVGYTTYCNSLVGSVEQRFGDIYYFDASNHHISGGVIHLETTGRFFNKGILSCNGPTRGDLFGGIIVISSDGVFDNSGTIECNPNGQILIECDYFKDAGTIDPVPRILARRIKFSEAKEVSRVCQKQVISQINQNWDIDAARNDFRRERLKINSFNISNKDAACICSTIIKNNIDSWKLCQMDFSEFQKMFDGRSRMKMNHQQLSAVLRMLKYKALSMDFKYVVAAVSHELEQRIANLVDSVAPDLGFLTGNSSEEIVHALKSKGTRGLTTMEVVYLKSLIGRAVENVTRAPETSGVDS